MKTYMAAAAPCSQALFNQQLLAGSKEKQSLFFLLGLYDINRIFSKHLFKQNV